jgi:hypothetical protein
VDPIVDWLRAQHFAVNRENYLDAIYSPEPVPDPVPAEVEADIPNCLQLNHEDE